MSDWWLVIENETAFPIASGSTMIGRAAACEIVLLGAQVSRKHACIERQEDSIEIRDLGSSLGTLVNDKTADATKLEDGDRITIGTTTMTLRHRLPEPAKVRPLPEGTPAGEGTTDWRPFRLFLDKLRRSGSAKEVLEQLLAGLVELLSAERGFVLLDDGSAGPLVPVASHNINDREERAVISKTVCQQAIDRQETLVILDSANDQRCIGAASLAAAERPRTIVCSPLLSDTRVIGAVYLDMPRAGHPITSAQRSLIETITGLAAELTSANRTRDELLTARGRVEALTELSLHEDKLVLGEGTAGQRLRQLIHAAAEQDIAVLVTGETGTGKEMVARALHRLSPRRTGPFVPVHCAALPRDIIEAELFGVRKGAFTGADEDRMGRFELASGGTLFLDEVGELPLDFQVKLLRVLQERTLRRLGGTKEISLDLRLVCATNVDVEEALRTGALRQDLYYRINVFRIELPALRERPDSIPALARHFLREYAMRCGKAITDLSAETMAALQTYQWPGNIRELKNSIERAVVLEQSSTIGVDSLPGIGTPSSSVGKDDLLLHDMADDFETARAHFERSFLERSLANNDGNVRAVARNAGIPRTSLYRMLQKYGLSGTK